MENSYVSQTLHASYCSIMITHLSIPHNFVKRKKTQRQSLSCEFEIKLIKNVHVFA